ncbi:hypothetical protein [Brevundimonas subvibrioides]|uniref:hypothetical protein n=1 Tax=Brevundimonas subvibrioides TaxID=74313 RepID=UPI0022B4D7ED|nr:hypothetical protein [Brevundimonas subvibrioides]
MTGNDTTPGKADRVTWTVTTICVAAMLVLMALNGMIELGSAAHDAFCPEHGWAV